MGKVDVHERERSLEQVEGVLREVEAWAAARGWKSERGTQEIKEARLGAYEAPTLTVDAPRARMVLEPVARFAFASEGRIDVYAWPTFRRLMLKRTDSGWRLETESGVPWPRPWSDSAFEELTELLGEAA